MAQPLATPEELEELFGVEVTEQAINRAAAAIRAAARSEISYGTHIQTQWDGDPVIHLKETPLQEIVSVVNAESLAEVSWRRTGESRIMTSSYGPVAVTYRAGYVEVPQDILAVLAKTAERIENTVNSAAYMRNVKSEATGLANISYDNVHVAIENGDQAVLDRFFPRRIRALLGGY